MDLNSSKIEKFFIDSSPLFEVHVFDESIQSGTNLCSKDNGGCEQLCFYVSGAVKCGCGTGYKVNSTDIRACAFNPDYKPATRCRETEFECAKNRKCIDRRLLCDGDDDCLDGSDEQTGNGGPCADHKCSADEFQCGNNRCIRRSWMCDGDSDCSDELDEKLCNNTNCADPKMFSCQNSSRCIIKEWECDHENDCGEGDTSDEHEGCEYPPCAIEHFQCRNKQCIAESFVCDGEKDCRDGSDEVNCAVGCAQGLEFRCPGSIACISVMRKCDGMPDCKDGSDEVNCDRDDPADCLANQFRCVAENTCIRRSFTCDGDRDCMDGSDEDLEECRLRKCAANETKCHNSAKCIPDHFFCNGHPDCPDGFDESDCSSTSLIPHVGCLKPNFLCGGDRPTCITPQKLCDGHDDCPDGSDESLNCGSKMCERPLAFPCYNTTYCHNAPTALGYICSCPPNLFLQPDGIGCSKRNPCEIWGICSQMCTSVGAHYKCSCEKDYALELDHFSCKYNGSDYQRPYVLFSNRHEIRLVGLEDETSSSIAVGLQNTIAIDYYYNHSNRDSSYIFWTDISVHRIYRGTLTKTTLVDVKVVVENGISTAEGIAVDWMGNNLYWVNNRNNESLIDVN